MKLINSDEMQEKAFQMNFRGKISERELFLFNRAIADMPTVDAVPIDFLKQFAEGKRGYYSDFVIEALKAWEARGDESGVKMKSPV
jgi:hypothetical protein